MSEKMKRHYGIDALRLLAMLMVIVLHVLGAGGVLASLEIGSLRYLMAWLLETSCYGAVNCYGLISGYVGVRTKCRYAGVAERWLQVLFYTVLPTMVFAVIQPEWVADGDIGRAFTPVISECYWFYTSYFCMSLLIPAMNHYLHTADRELQKRMLATAFLLFCCLAPCMEGDYFQINMGYSPLWLGVLYLTGGYLRLYGDVHTCGAAQKIRVLVLYGGCVVVSWGLKLLDDANVLPPAIDQLLAHEILQYNSPLIALGALGLFGYFALLSPGPLACRWIAWLSPATFGVYLIHTQPVIWKHVLPRRFWAMQYMRAYELPFAVLAVSAAVFVACVGIDRLREGIFRWIGVKAFCRRLFARVDAD